MSTLKADDSSLNQDNTDMACATIGTQNQSSPSKIQSILANKKRIIHRYFDELSQAYIQSHNRDLKDFNIKGISKLMLEIHCSIALTSNFGHIFIKKSLIKHITILEFNVRQMKSFN